MAADPRVRIGKTGPEDDRRGAELPVDMRVALVVEHEVERAVVRTVRELHKAELLDRCDEPEPDPVRLARLGRLGGAQREEEGRGREEPVAAAERAVAGDADHGRLAGRAHELPRIARVRREEGPEARAGREEAVRRAAQERAAAEQVHLRQVARAAGPRS